MDWQCLWALVVIVGHMFDEEFVCEFIEPPTPLKLNYYRCDKRFHVDKITSLFENQIKIGVAWIIGDEYQFYVVQGSKCQCVSKDTTIRNTKSRRGGSSSARFQRKNDNSVKAWAKFIRTELLSSYWDYSVNKGKVDGLIICGSGPLRESVNIPGELREILMDNVVKVSISMAVCHELYNMYNEICKNKSSSKMANKLLDELLLDDSKIVYGIREINELVGNYMVKQLVYTTEIKSKLNLDKAKEGGCKLVETNSQKIKELGGVIGKTWY